MGEASCQSRLCEIRQDGEGAPQAKRAETLNKKGFRVLRFWNSDWVENQAGVLETIVATWSMPAARPHHADYV